MSSTPREAWKPIFGSPLAPVAAGILLLADLPFPRILVHVCYVEGKAKEHCMGSLHREIVRHDMPCLLTSGDETEGLNPRMRRPTATNMNEQRRRL